MLTETGIPTKEDLLTVTPPDERFARGPVVVTECFQEIPCDPCVDACGFNAITKPGGINDLPKVDFDKCTGCGLCIAKCPGLAIFVIDKTYSATHAVVRFPYEFIPVPEEGQYALGLDREGKEMGWFEVTRVVPGGPENKTAVLWLAVPKELSMEVRNIRVGGFRNNG
jgi:Fe-S-cluster-containing hydrogenase component 2